jgi:hypothetical protein
MIVTEDEVGELLNFLSQTDATVAELEGEMLLAQKRIERIKDRLYIAEDGTVPERKAKANRSPEVAVEEENEIKATIAFKSLKAQRDTAKIKVDVWRSCNSARKAGL